MKKFEIKVNQPFIYVGNNTDFYGKTVRVQSFSVFWVMSLYKKPSMVCKADIVIDDILDTVCDIEDLIPIQTK